MATGHSSPSGVLDHSGADLAGLRWVEAAILASFEQFAYAPASPPILEWASVFLDRSGEEIRRRLYAFHDPGGREVCLRPDLTIPICRLHLRQNPNTGKETRESRISYSGPAFRYVSPGPGSYRQFHQAGVEFLGAACGEAADAEVLAVALDGIRRAGIAAPSVILGDLSVVHAFVDGLSVGPHAKTKLKRIAWNKTALGRVRDRISLDAENRSKNAGETDKDLIDGLRALGRDQAPDVIREILSLIDVRHVGGRTPEDIAERLIARSDEATEPLSVEMIAAVEQLLTIRGAAAAALGAVRRLAAEAGVTTMDEALRRVERRFELIKAYDGNAHEFVFDAGLRPELAYYTGFVFEIYSPRSSDLGHLCGGGRYDGLLQALGARGPVPAVGCAIGLERLLLAVKREEALPGPPSAQTRVLVVAAGKVPYEACISVSTLLRQRGWLVETDASARRPRSVLSNALERGAAFVVIVGEEEFNAGKVRLKRLIDRDERVIAIADLPSARDVEAPAPAKARRKANHAA